MRKGLAPAHTVLSWVCMVLAALAAGAAITMGLLEGVPFHELLGSCADERPRKPAAASSEESLACSACCCRSTMLRLRVPMAGGRDRSLQSTAGVASEGLQTHFESLQEQALLWVWGALYRSWQGQLLSACRLDDTLAHAQSRSKSLPARHDKNSLGKDTF